jgi:hypothetical protein
LHAGLEAVIKREEVVAAFDHWFGLALMGVVLICSGAAVIGGLAEWLASKAMGGLALVPGALAIVAATLKFEGKANWHYRKRDGLTALIHRLDYQLPAEPSAADVVAQTEMREGIAKIISLAGVREAMGAGGMEVVRIGTKNENGQLSVSSQLADSA